MNLKGEIQYLEVKHRGGVSKEKDLLMRQEENGERLLYEVSQEKESISSGREQ